MDKRGTIIAKKLLVVLVTWLLAVLSASHSAGAHAATLPCPFNSMCTCKMAAAAGHAQGASGNTNGTSNPAQLLLEADDMLDEEFEQEESDAPDASIVKDVSCVGVPFAALPGKLCCIIYLQSHS